MHFLKGTARHIFSTFFRVLNGNLTAAHWLLFYLRMRVVVIMHIIGYAIYVLLCFDHKDHTGGLIADVRLYWPCLWCCFVESNQTSTWLVYSSIAIIKERVNHTAWIYSFVDTRPLTSFLLLLNLNRAEHSLYQDLFDIIILNLLIQI